MRSVDISWPALTGCHRTDVTLPHPDAIPSDQPCWLPGMSKSSFLPTRYRLTITVEILGLEVGACSYHRGPKQWFLVGHHRVDYVAAAQHQPKDTMGDYPCNWLQSSNLACEGQQHWLVAG